MADLFDVNGKNIVITGGAGVLCGQMAKDLAAGGARVCLADYNEAGAKEVCKEIESDGGFAIAVKMNVLEKDSVQSGFDSAVAGLGSIDVLINGAGGNKKDATATDELSFFDIPAEAMRSVLDLNLVGTVLPSQVFGKYMADKGAGVIINVSSMCAFSPLTKVVGYSAAKAAVSNFTQWLSVHMCQKFSTEIRVNAIAPGFFLTEQNRFLLTDEATGDLTPRGQTIIDHTPMGRYGAPEDLTGTVQWLISDAAKFVTGIVVPIDGGFSAFSGV